MPVFSFLRSIEMYMEKFLHTLVYTTLYLSILLYTYSFYTCLIFFAHVYTCLYTYINTCICIFVYTHFSVNNCLPTRVYTHLSMFACLHFLVYYFVYKYISMHTCQFVLAYTFLSTHLSILSFPNRFFSLSIFSKSILLSWCPLPWTIREDFLVLKNIFEGDSFFHFQVGGSPYGGTGQNRLWRGDSTLKN